MKVNYWKLKGLLTIVFLMNYSVPAQADHNTETHLTGTYDDSYCGVSTIKQNGNKVFAQDGCTPQSSGVGYFTSETTLDFANFGNMHQTVTLYDGGRTLKWSTGPTWTFREPIHYPNLNGVYNDSYCGTSYIRQKPHTNRVVAQDGCNPTSTGEGHFTNPTTLDFPNFGNMHQTVTLTDDGRTLTWSTGPTWIKK